MSTMIVYYNEAGISSWGLWDYISIGKRREGQE